MKYLLWGQIEGICVSAADALWIAVRDGIVADLSQEARAKGVRPGMKASSAQALAPELRVYELPDEPTQRMEAVWEILYGFTPWLETISQQGFCAQITAAGAPLEEVRILMERLVPLLGEQARLTVGLSRSPARAHALVAWQVWQTEQGGPTPPGIQVQLDRHVLLCDTALLTRYESSSPSWLEQLPVGAVWFLPAHVREVLPGLGIATYGQFQSVSRHRLQRMFGREAAAWQTWFETEPASVRCNYPLPTLEQSWQAAAGEAADRHAFGELVNRLLEPVAKALERASCGAVQFELRWITDQGEQVWRREAKRLVTALSAMRVLLEPAEGDCQGRQITGMTLVVSGIRPQNMVQSAFWPKEGFAAPRTAKDSAERVVTRLKSRFPGQVGIGLKPSFRELRWHAVVDP